MYRKPYIVRRGENWYIFPSADGVNYKWAVYNFNSFTVVAEGKERTYDQAFRAVRNFIKNNQELVYGSNKKVAA